MLEKKLPEEKPEFEIVCLEDYVPQDHLLRKIKKHIDFSFIYDIVSLLYSPNTGRPALEPIMLMKMLFIGYLKMESVSEEDTSPETSRSETGSVPTPEIKVSTTDAKNGYMYCEGKPEGFFYLDHRTVDFKYNIITDVHITAGNVHDSVPFRNRLERQKTRFGFEVEAVAPDAGYLTSALCHGLSKTGIFGVTGYRRYSGEKGMFFKWKYRYNPERDCYMCPGYPKGEQDRPPRGIELMLRMYLLQVWFNLSDEMVEDSIYYSYAMRHFVGLNFFEEQVPDATTLLKFRHLLEEHHLGEKLFQSITDFCRRR